MKKLVLIVALAGCQTTTPEGCPIYMTELMRPKTEACVAAYREEMAKASGGTVTRCSPVGDGLSCVSY